MGVGTALLKEINVVLELNHYLNELAGTRHLDAAGAANAWAGTSGLELVGALNFKNGTRGVELQGVLNQLANTQGLGVCLAASKIVGV